MQSRKALEGLDDGVGVAVWLNAQDLVVIDLAELGLLGGVARHACELRSGVARTCRAYGGVRWRTATWFSAPRPASQLASQLQPRVGAFAKPTDYTGRPAVGWTAAGE